MNRSANFDRTLIFAALAAGSLLIWWHPLATTFDLARSNEAYTHILLILPLSAALIYFDLKNRKSLSSDLDPARRGSKNNDLDALQFDSKASPRLGAALFAFSLLIGCYARWGIPPSSSDIGLALSMFGLVTFWIADAVFCFGYRAVRFLLLPFSLLFFLVPIPQFALDAIVGWLQHGSAWMASVLFHSAGETVSRDGVFIYLTGLNIEVAKECSSIRSSFLLVITTVVLAHLYLKSWWRNLLLVLISIPLSIAKNGLRIFVIAELGTRVDESYLEGSFHHHGGIVFLVIALAAVVTLLILLRKAEVFNPAARSL
jgi:exosortase